MIDQVAPGLYRLPLPLLDNPLGSVNTYVVEGDDGIVLVDCGWDTPDAYAALVAGLASLQRTIGDIHTPPRASRPARPPRQGQPRGPHPLPA